jgi:HTH-type transcriptional regulator/antitoxin HipB
MDYPIQSAGQLSSHLRSLRKARGLSQAQLGAALGVGQTRITRIERDPAAVSVEQFLEILGVLGVQMVLRPAGDRAAAELPARGPGSAPARVAAAKRRPPDEPW